MSMRLIVCVLACLGAGWVGSLFTRPGLGRWYASLVKPAWTPPGWLFGPVWTGLYIMMAVAAWLAWRRVPLASTPMRLFALQLLLNVGWSAIFFWRRAPGWALLEIALLWAAILLTTLSFAHISRLGCIRGQPERRHLAAQPVSGRRGAGAGMNWPCGAPGK
jgi:benzodiazapine receptor